MPTHATTVPKDAARVFHGVIFDVYQWQQALFDGSTATFEMLKRPDTVKVIAVKEDKIVVTEQEQPNTGVFYSFPGGRHDTESETELQAAQRELLEETGMTFSNWRLIAAVQPEVKIDWVVYTFLATGFLSQDEQRLDAGEKIRVVLKTIEEINSLDKNANPRHLGKDILAGVRSTQELEALPELFRY